jgi:hypothetical protein
MVAIFRPGTEFTANVEANLFIEGTREYDLDVELRLYTNKCIAALNNQLYFSADEYACSICNTYFATVLYRSDLPILQNIADVFSDIGNLKNSAVMKNIVARIENCQSLDVGGSDGDVGRSNGSFLFDVMEPLITEETRTKLRLLSTEYDSKYCRNFEENFIRQIANYKLMSPASGTRVLDIGTGFGYFPYLCERNGHGIEAIDISDVPQVYNESCKILGVAKRDFAVEKYTPLPSFTEKFHMVVCSQICFNGHASDALWDVDEWLWFLGDLHDNVLTDSGFVWLSFNCEEPDTGGAPLGLGKKSVEALFEPYQLHIELGRWKAVKLTRDAIAALTAGIT